MPRYKRATSYMGPKATQQRTGESKFATQAQTNAGIANDVMISPATLDAAVDALIASASTTVAGKIRISTDLEAVAGVSTTTAMTPHTVGLIAIAGAPLASEILAGIAELATQAETIAFADDARIVTPLKLGQALAAPAAIGSTTPAAGAFTNLAATGVGTGNILTSNTASSMTVTGAGADLTLDSAAGRVIINGEEAAANAITLVSAAGGLDVNTALQINIDSSQVAATAVVISASGGGVDVTAAVNDIDITSTLASVNLVANEAAADAISLTASAGGIVLGATGAAGLDIGLTNTGGSIYLTATENAADAIVLSATAGGIDIGCVGTAGEDIDIVATGSSVNITSIEDAASAIYLRANGGTSETIYIRADQGTGVASVNIASDVGGLTLTSGLASADAINITATNAAGGIDIDSGTNGFIVDTTGGISLDATAASNFTATGAFDITVQSTAGSILINAGEAAADALNIDAAAGGLDVNVALQMNLDSAQAAADAIRVISSNAAGGIDIDTGTGGATLDSTGAISIDGAAASNFTVGGAGIDLTLSSTLGRVIVNAEEAAANAITLLSAAGGLDINTALQINIDSSQAAATAIVLNTSDAAGGVDINAGTGGITIDTTDAISIDSVAASNMTITGAADLTLSSTAGSVVIDGGEAVADAITLTASDAAGGITMNVGTGNVVVAGGNLNLSSAATQLIMNGGAATDFIGRATFVAGQVVVANTNIAATDRIFCTRYALNGSPAVGHIVSTIAAGATITFDSIGPTGAAVATDVTSFDYFIVRQL
jgi:hypothetical protein